MIVALAAPLSAHSAPSKRRDEGLEYHRTSELEHHSTRRTTDDSYEETTPAVFASCRTRENKLRNSESLLALAECFNDLALSYQEQGAYGKAELLLERALATTYEAVGTNHTSVATLYGNLASLYRRRAMYREAKDLHDRALAIDERALGREHPMVARDLINLALLHQELGAYDSAEPLVLRALSIHTKAFGPEHPLGANVLNNLASLRQDGGAYEEAEKLFEKALAIKEQSLGKQHPSVATTLGNLASLHHIRGAHHKARPLYERALAIHEKALGTEHLDVATDLNNLASLHRDQGDHSNAEKLFVRALRIKEEALGPEHPDVATTLDNLAVLYHDQGEYAKAEPLMRRACAAKEAAFGADHPAVAICLSNLGSLLHDQGEYGKAESLHARALTIREQTLGPRHSSVAVSLNNLASLHHDQGAYDTAKALYERALSIDEDVLGPDHPIIATRLNNLAMLHADRGNYDEAGPLYERALSISTRALGSDHSSVAELLENLGSLRRAEGRSNDALALHERALAIHERRLGPHHPAVARELRSLAVLHHRQGAYAAALPLFKRALAIDEEALGPDHPSTGQDLNGLAVLYQDQGKYDQATKHLQRSLDVEEGNLTRAFAVAEESRRLAYASKISDSLRYVLSSHLHVTPRHRQTAELALTTLLRRKNRVQDLVGQSHALLRQRLPKEKQHLFDDLSTSQARYSALASRGPVGASFEEFSVELQRLHDTQEEIWRQLGLHGDLLAEAGRPPTIGDVQRVLPMGGVLIELVKYAPLHDADGFRVEGMPPRYAAYLVHPRGFDWVDLGEADPIDQQVLAFRRGLVGKTAISTDLYEVVMRPILERLPEATDRLIIAPDGELSLVPFGAFYDGLRFLVEEYEVRYVSTGRDLLRSGLGPATTSPVAVVASPAGVRLPGTEGEAAFVAGMFPNAQVLVGDRATETNVRALARPLILHIATHGFFGRTMHLTDNPMLHSGLVLARAKATSVGNVEQAKPAEKAEKAQRRAPSNVDLDDGQLTAYEVSGWDLRGTQLVVLSACGTGLGKVEMGEGVLGLRRAFAMAGAEALVVSLWRVSDEPTQELMEAYYLELAKGKGRGEAMQDVQLQMLRSANSSHPGDWAAFIVTGDDAPMRFPAGEEPVIAQPIHPPPVEHHRRGGCNAGGTDRDLPLTSVLLALLGLGALRRRRL